MTTSDISIAQNSFKPAICDDVEQIDAYLVRDLMDLMSMIAAAPVLTDAAKTSFTNLVELKMKTHRANIRAAAIREALNAVSSIKL